MTKEPILKLDTPETSRVLSDLKLGCNKIWDADDVSHFRNTEIGIPLMLVNFQL